MILKEGITQCCWSSTKLNAQCDRKALEGEDYCLFHKPNKNEFEGRVFWKIINWQWKTDKLFGVHPSDPSEWEKYNEAYRRLQLQEDEINFPDADRRYPQYQELRISTKNLYLSRNLGRAGNFRVAYFDGFVFPAGIEEAFQFRTIGEGDWPIYFRECVFKSGIYFSHYNFTSLVEFINVRFEGWVIFYRTVFAERAVFSNIYIGCGLANYRVFERTKFHGVSVEFKNFQPHRLELDKAEFGVGTRLVDSGNYFELDPGTASYGRSFHQIARRVSLSNGDFDQAGTHYYHERVYRREEMKIVEDDSISWRIKQQYCLLLDWFAAHTCGYGEKPFRAITFSAFTILFFTYCYWFEKNLIMPVVQKGKTPLESIADALFTSLFVFTTIGYGDLNNYTWLGKILASFEVVIGLIMIAGGTVTLLRKAIR